MKEQFISMKTTSNPAKFVSGCEEISAYSRKANSFKSLSADEEKEIATIRNAMHSGQLQISNAPI